MVGDFNKKTGHSHYLRGSGKSASSQRQASSGRKNSLKFKKWLYFSTFLLVVSLGILQIYFSNRLATQGKKLNDCEVETLTIEKENETLKSEIALLGGMSKVTQAALEKGFVKNPPIISLSKQIPVALNSQ